MCVEERAGKGKAIEERIEMERGHKRERWERGIGKEGRKGVKLKVEVVGMRMK